jgi:drug/metabolite transporter (DMT)-like permease
MFFFSVMNNCVRQASLEMHSTQITLIRSVMVAGMMALWILHFHGKALLRTALPKRHMIRAVMGITATEMWFYALGHMPINEATALSFTTPLFVTLFAILFLKERSTYTRWAAVALGAFGTLVILRPDTGHFDDIALMVLASAALLAGLSILIKTITRLDHPDTIVFYQGLMMTPLAIPFAIPFWQPLTLPGFLWVAAVACTSIIAQLFMVRAFTRSDMVVLMPVDFTRLIFTAAIAYWWFEETLGPDTLTGSLLIIAGSVWGAMEGNTDIRRKLRRLSGFWRNH